MWAFWCENGVPTKACQGIGGLICWPNPATLSLACEAKLGRKDIALTRWEDPEHAQACRSFGVNHYLLWGIGRVLRKGKTKSEISKQSN